MIIKQYNPNNMYAHHLYKRFDIKYMAPSYNLIISKVL